ncbi:MAG: F0F1 ATP synthase subunit epsilon [Candidatus Magasanikbacteria bacterium]|nr:F0F1 ATP synthase subunit epsilon [Candidatus Magasanikbacteria bacterium]
MSKINLKIVTPEKIIYQNDQVDQVSIPTSTGEITVLPNHIPLVSILKSGEMIFKENGQDNYFAVSGGFLEVKDGNEVIILADNVERAHEINIEKAEAAKAKAETQMRELHNREDVDFAKLQAVIDREANRLRVGNKYRKLPKSE